MFFENPILGAFMILVLRAMSVAIATVRLLIMGRGSKLLVAAIAVFEALTFALTFGQVAQDLTNIYNLSAYSIGFAAGTWVGTTIEEKVGMGYATMMIVSTGHSLPIVEAVRKAGYGATRSAGEGTSGAVGFVWVVVKRKNIQAVMRIAQQIDSRSFVTIGEARSVTRGFLGFGRS